MRIWVNTIVHNEENFVWFAVMSVIDFVDRVLIYDTGSTDKTVEIIRQIQKVKKNKIIFKEVGPGEEDAFPKLRQQMLKESDCDWLIVVDGDEIWWEKSIKKLIQKIKKDGDKLDGIAVPYFVSLGDIYHYQEERAGQYQLLGKKGHFSLRAINKKVPGLHVSLPYGHEGYFDKDNQPVQERKGVVFLDSSYLHTTHLKRSGNRRKKDKFKFELGKSFQKTFLFPEVLFRPRPEIVPSPWKKQGDLFLLRSLPLTPLRKLKRRIKDHFK